MGARRLRHRRGHQRDHHLHHHGVCGIRDRQGDEQAHQHEEEGRGSRRSRGACRSYQRGAADRDPRSAEEQVSGRYFIGGIFAYASRADAITIQNCYDSSDLSGAENVGGIVGNGDNIRISNCYYEGELIRTSGTQTTFAAIVNFPSFFSGTTELYNCFSTTNSVITGSDLTVSGSLKTPDYVGTDENNYVFDASQLAVSGYDAVIKGAAWGEGSTWNDETIWSFYPDRLPELKLSE